MRDGLTVAVLLVLGLLALAGARSGARREVEQVCRHAIQREYRVGAAEAQRVIDAEKARSR
jgi:hypothetical protein